MYVRNVAGYNFAFKYRDAVMYIPYDGRIYSIPDDSGTYRELRVIQPMHIRTQAVTYINKDGSVASGNLSGHKRRGRPPKPVRDPDKPLKGVKVKKDETTKPKTTPDKINETDTTLEITNVDVNDVNVSIVDIDLDRDLVVETKVEEKAEETSQPKKRGRPRKDSTITTNSTKATPKKKRGRPKKTQ